MKDIFRDGTSHASVCPQSYLTSHILVVLLIQKLCIYLQWVRWILGVGLAGKQYVIVTMDETHVSQLTTGDKGMVPHKDMVRQEPIKRLARKIDRTEGKHHCWLVSATMHRCDRNFHRCSCRAT